MVTWVRQEPQWQAVDALLTQSGSDPVLPGPALTETIMVTRRKGNRSSGAQILSTLRSFGVRIEHPTDSDLVRAAELLELSETHPARTVSGPGSTLSLGDALILAVAERLACVIVSRDHYWAMLATDGLTTAKIQTF